MQRLLLYILLLACAPLLRAQNTDWLVKPEFDAMEYYGPQMYKVTKSGKFGIVTADGRTLLEPKYDFISPFYEGRSVVADNEGDKLRVKGTLTTDGTAVLTDEPVYLCPKYPFYSEGFLPVKNDKGLYSYLDEKGKVAFPFTSRESRPFCEGIASIGVNDDFRWLTVSGEILDMRLPNGGTPYLSTSYHNGEAYVQDEDGEMFFLSNSGEARKIATRPIEPDYLFRADTKSGKEIPYASFEPETDNYWRPSQRQGKWGYLNEEGKPLCLYKYDAALAFAYGSAPARQNGRWGLIEVVPDDATFSLSTKNRSFVYSPGGSCRCEFALAVPEKYADEKLQVSVKDRTTGQAVNYTRQGNAYAFNVKPSGNGKNESHTFDVAVKVGDFEAWRGEETYTFTQRVKLTASISLRNNIADPQGRCYVTATVRNPSSIPVTTTVTLSGGGEKTHFSPVSMQLTVPANGAKSVQGYFSVQKVEQNAWCNVKLSDGAQKGLSKITLRPN